ncbi:MAG: hypothetical protein KGQ86_03955 [Bacteroidetes bacterium]|nr:hypothetical protein [Bacteroidota bacterium]
MSLFLTLFIIITALFLSMLFLSFYFRIKVLNNYQILVRHKVAFEAMDIFNPGKLEKEVIPKYPDQAQAIRDFSRYIRLAIKMASVLIVLITLLGAVLMYFRE